MVNQNNQQEYYPSEGEQKINAILAKVAETIKNKYNLKPCGVGVAMPGGPIRTVTLCFDTNYPYSQEQLRESLIKTAQELFNQIVENKDIQKFLYERPFNIKKVQVIIYNHDKEGRTVYAPGISDGQISDGILNYSTVDKNDSYKYKDQFDESYDEALKLLKNMNK